MKKNHQNKLKAALLYILLFLLSSGCSDWLQVDLVDRTTQGQVFSSEENIQQALNGIYIQMGKNTLYGRDLSVGAIELLAQQYTDGNTEGNPLKYYLVRYNYTVDVTKNKFLSIWSEAYSTILNINNFIENLDQTQEVIIPSRKDLLLGEAYGLRAYLHLDLLRLFGPVYLTDSTGLSIPYRDQAKIEYGERIAATQVMDRIMGDLDKSIALLKNDPVITQGVMAMPEDSLSVSQEEINAFYRYRNRRMNYYAAGTLKVRALMYRNNKQAASALAKSLLDSSAVPDKFPWAANADVFRFDKEDRIFSSEVLFGVHAPDMYSNWTTLFSPGITVVSSLYASLTRNMENLFEVSSGQLSLCTDWRSKNWKEYGADADYMVTYKLAKSNKETAFWYFQPLIRKAELYYILAECEGNVDYVDAVRTKRNLKKVEDLKPVYDLDTEILNEFIREMHNEGQIFYFYKRKNLGQIQSGSSTATVSMSGNEYVIPVPQRELDK
jgi:hypothetical protein